MVTRDCDISYCNLLSLSTWTRNNGDWFVPSQIQCSSVFAVMAAAALGGIVDMVCDVTLSAACLLDKILPELASG